MTQEEIKDLIAFLDEKKSINRLKIKDKEFELEIKKEDKEHAFTETNSACPTLPSVNVVVGEKSDTHKKPTLGDTINSPMVGTFYKAPSPGASPFVSIGQAVKKGECIGIIEAMKIMNEVEAEFDCRIVKSLVEDGQPVEYGMAIYEVEKI